MKIENEPIIVTLKLSEAERDALVRTIRKVTSNLSEINGDFSFLNNLLEGLNEGRKFK
jgi:hypothetical protein